jgi:hypothetical protein
MEKNPERETGNNVWKKVSLKLIVTRILQGC